MGKVGRSAAPWTPTRELKKRKSYFKRCGHMMETLERERDEGVSGGASHRAF